ncbi:FliH/SctL family protein [Calditerrivibrio nitroreducens]|uniref:Flagellar assembly protein FliH n=1 Tax=Calditerrivibrio nitroreducens (strain DSM 19672 / NBRC 101217 / Yu37-1) TaxID=768670 RepID=E4TGA3_CALNY|nr:FliH/SctL family protein [Calditerrivibrio nitroreducens]ADR19690.1 Flagellar assembly protein FliH/Type III secretion system HrpE [Calditerrivibrio nitroreducens DSM 19672]
MPRKIVKRGDTKGFSSFAFKTFSSVDRGISVFSYKPFEIKKEEILEEKKEEAPEEEREEISTLTVLQQEYEEKLKEEYERGLKDGLEKGFITGKEEGLAEGYQKGYAEAEQKLNKDYQARKEDYLKLLQNELSGIQSYINRLHSFLDEIDRELPMVVLNLINGIVGVERKINDRLVINIVKKAFSKLKDIEITDIIVNPKDVEIVQEYFSGYNVIGDGGILQGSVKIKTKIGEADFSIESILNDLTKNIYEELGIN